MTSSVVPLNSQIGEVVLHLSRLRRVSRAELVEVLGISDKTFGRRLRGQLDWTAEEVRLLSERLNAPVAVFYGGPDALFSGIVPGQEGPTGSLRWDFTPDTIPAQPSVREPIAA